MTFCFDDPESSRNHYYSMTTPAGLRVSTRHVDTDYHTTFWMDVNATWLTYPRNDMTLDSKPELFRFAIYRSTTDLNFKVFNQNVTDCSLALSAFRYTNAHVNGTAFAFEHIRQIELDEHGFSYDVPYDPIHIAESQIHRTPILSISTIDLMALDNFFRSGKFMTEWVNGNYANRNVGLSAALNGGDVNLTARFESMARSMADYVRSGPDQMLARGERIEVEAFVSIRWHFMAVPIAIEVAALFFTILTMIVNRRST